MRRSGTTTRKIDKAVQTLFKEGVVYIPSIQELHERMPKLRGTGYHPDSPSCKANVVFVDGHTFNQQVYFLTRLLNRLTYEHSMIYSGKSLPINRLIKVSDFWYGKKRTEEPNLWDEIGTKLGYFMLKLRLKTGLW